MISDGALSASGDRSTWTATTYWGWPLSFFEARTTGTWDDGESTGTSSTDTEDTVRIVAFPCAIDVGTWIAMVIGAFLFSEMASRQTLVVAGITLSRVLIVTFLLSISHAWMRPMADIDLMSASAIGHAIVRYPAECDNAAMWFFIAQAGIASCMCAGLFVLQSTASSVIRLFGKARAPVVKRLSTHCAFGLHVGVLAIAVTSGIWRARETGPVCEAIEEIRACGGVVAFSDHQVDVGPSQRVWIEPSWIEVMLGTTSVVRVDFLGANDIGSPIVQLVRKLPSVEELSLSGTGITDSALASIVQLPRLRSLDLSGTRVTERGIRLLTECKNLRRLSLVRGEVSHEDVHTTGARLVPRISRESLARIRAMLPAVTVVR